MSEDERRNAGVPGWMPAGAHASADDPSAEESPELDRLPPPVFPPGARLAAAEGSSSTSGQGFPAGAFISPDDPIRRSSGTLDDALISPDEPIRHRSPRDREADEEYGVATGIGDDGPVYARDHAFHQTGDAEAVRRVAECLEHIARDLRRYGTSSLGARLEGPRLEVMLKGLLSGYLLGRGD
jgi:hypothetical protein